MTVPGFSNTGTTKIPPTREDGLERYVDKEAYDKLHELWDKYHLKKVDEEEITRQMDEIESKLNVDWEEWITDYIREELM